MGTRSMNRVTTRQFCLAFDVRPHTLRAAAKRLKLGDQEHYGRLLLTPEEVLKLVLEIRSGDNAIAEKEDRKVIRRALFDYCKTKG
jgi:hypothetical protein